jgi:hypothetical protein
MYSFTHKRKTTKTITTMFSKSTVAAAVLSLVACVHADNHEGEGKPASIVGYTPVTDVRDQVCLF